MRHDSYMASSAANKVSSSTLSICKGADSSAHICSFCEQGKKRLRSRKKPTQAELDSIDLNDLVFNATILFECGGYLRNDFEQSMCMAAGGWLYNGWTISKKQAFYILKVMTSHMNAPKHTALGSIIDHGLHLVTRGTPDPKDLKPLK